MGRFTQSKKGIPSTVLLQVPLAENEEPFFGDQKVTVLVKQVL